MTNEYDKKIFAKNLSYYMNLNGENQSDIAKLLNVSKTTITHYIKGTNVPRMGKVQILCDHYGIKLSDLIEDKKESEKDTEIHTIAAHAIGELNDEDIEEIIRLAKHLKSKYKD